MNKNLIELFRSKNQDDIRLAFLIAKQTNVPIYEVNLMYGLLPMAFIAEPIAKDLTNYSNSCQEMFVNAKYINLLPELEKFRNSDGEYYTYEFFTGWKED